MSKPLKIASYVLISALAVAWVAVVASLIFGRGPVAVFSENLGLFFAIFALPAILAVSLVVFLHRLAVDQIEGPPQDGDRADRYD
jgi:hypothetical protein